MKIVKKVNARLTVLLMFIFFLQALLWAGYLTRYLIYMRNVIPFILFIFAILTVGLFIVRVTNYFTKDFKLFYDSLDWYDKSKLDARIATVSSGQSTIFMDTYFVNYSFVVLKVIPYKNIALVEHKGKKILVCGKTPKETVVIGETEQLSISDILERIQNENQEIIVK